MLKNTHMKAEEVWEYEEDKWGAERGKYEQLYTCMKMSGSHPLLDMPP